MNMPIVAIVGRPNVGKSSLLNCLVGRRIAIVDAVAGVTRDRLSTPVPVGDGYVEFVDTGGFGIEDVDDLTDHIVNQIDFAMAEASLALFLVDAQEGLRTLDRAVAKRLRRQGTPVLLVANKVDNDRLAEDLAELSALGFGEPLAVSALHKTGIDKLMNAVLEVVGELAEAPEEPVMKIAIVGRRNVGKSTFINTLAGVERVIVSEVAGTTRDSIDVRIEIDGRTLLAIDTAGVRKKSKLADDIEYYSRHRSFRSIRRADAVLLLMDATQPVGKVDKQLAEYITDNFKPLILVVNKWDLAATQAERDDYGPYLTKQLPGVGYAPIIFTAAATGQGVREAVSLAGDLVAQSRQRVSTSELNTILGEITSRHAPRSSRAGRGPKVYYAAQIDVAPPTIAMFVNDVQAFEATYRRYLTNRFREELPFPEVPIRLLIRPRRHGRSDVDRGGAEDV